MPRGSYLRHTASRAVRHDSEIVPMPDARALPQTPQEEPEPIVERPVATDREPLPAFNRDRDSARAVSFTLAQPVETKFEEAARAPAIATVAIESKAPVAIEPAPKAHAPLVPDSARSAGEPPSARTTVEIPRADRLRTTAPPLPPPPATRATDVPSRSGMPMRKPAAAPLAAALVAAVKWTSSDPSLRASRAASRPTTSATPPSPKMIDEVSRTPREPSRSTPAIAAADVFNSPTDVPVLRPSPRTAPVNASRETTAPHIHIGSIEVEILPLPASETPIVAAQPAPPPSAPASVTRLTRGLTSAIGLRQS